MWWTGFETAWGRIASIDCFDIPAWKLFVCHDAGSILREEAAFNIQNIIANRKTRDLKSAWGGGGGGLMQVIKSD